MKCWHCGGVLEDLPMNRIPFRELCDHCGAYLHCCKNCKNYKPGLPNDCMVPGTDYIADREAGNFCEEFLLLGEEVEGRGSAEDAAKRLFGDADDVEKGKSFDDLF